MPNRRGFSLIELLVVMIIMLTVTAGIVKLLNNTQRLSRAQSVRVDLQSNVRTAAIVVPSELREINAVTGGTGPQNDVRVMQQTSITYRAMRGLGTICNAPDATHIRLRRSTWAAYRDPQAVRDTLYVFVENSEDLTSDDAWQAQGITNVSTANTCPDGTASITLTLNPGLPVQPVGTPVRTFELMQLSLYQQGGKSWLGATSVSAGEAVQPLLGPLVDVNGLRFKYLDANGNVTAVNSDVKSITMTVRGETSQKISTGGGNGNLQYLQDSLVSQVSLRNAFRP